MPPAAPQQNQTDNHMAPIWIVAGVFVVVVLIWYFLKVPIIRGFLFIKLQEVDVLRLIVPSLNGTKELILNADPTTMSFAEVADIANQVGKYIAIFAAACFLIFAILLYRKSAGMHFRRTYTMKSLLKLENQNWPQTTPVMGLDLVGEDIEKGPWAMSKTPMQFAKFHHLLKEQKRVMEEGMLSREARMEVSLNKARMADVFVKQLGRPWQGVEKLNMHTKALFAAFAARGAGHPEAAAKLLLQISRSSASKKINFAGANELLAKYGRHKLVVEVTEKHAFVYTVMASMLELARTVGVQASVDFLWLKPLDRRLWYMLNAVGRQTPQVEVAAPFAHWVVEKQLGYRILTPMIEEASKALDEAIQSVIYKPDEDKN